jgi:hypothetical protein
MTPISHGGYSVQVQEISMKRVRQKLTLDQPAIYQIKVPGYLDENWLDWAGEMAITVESEGDDLPITALTGTVDQATLQGLLRRLYALGLPLISVNCLECTPKD